VARALITIAGIAVLLLLIAGAAGFVSVSTGEPWRLYHLFIGLFASLLTTFIHCMVIFYFIGTAKVIREAAAEMGAKDRDYARETRRLAAKVHPLATLAIGVTLVGTLLGGAVRGGLVSPTVHLVGVVVLLAANLWVFRAEHRAARINSGLIDDLETTFARRQGAPRA
jgi:hypothetical protein